VKYKFSSLVVDFLFIFLINEKNPLWLFTCICISVSGGGASLSCVRVRKRECVCVQKMWPFSRKGASGFSSSSTAEQVTEGIDGTGLTAIVTG